MPLCITVESRERNSGRCEKAIRSNSTCLRRAGIVVGPKGQQAANVVKLS